MSYLLSSNANIETFWKPINLVGLFSLKKFYFCQRFYGLLAHPDSYRGGLEHYLDKEVRQLAGDGSKPEQPTNRIDSWSV